MKTLHDQGLNNVVFHQLDIGNPQSVSDFARWVKDNYGGLDILVNNAGVSGISIDSEAAVHALQEPDLFNKPQLAEAFETNYEMSKNCIETNYYGTKRVTEALLPLLRSEGRIVNVSSEPGLLKFLENDSLRRQLSNVSEITEELLDKMLETFLDDMKMDRLEGKGWPKFSPQFALSEMALNAYARLLAQKLSNSEEGKRLYVNSVNPGSIQTAMSGYTGDLTASEGAESIVMVALLPPGGRVNMKVDIGARARRNQNRRLWAYGLSFSAVAGFIIVVLGSFQEYLVFYVTPTDAMEKFTKDPSKSKFRLGGLVVEGSLMQPASSMETEFVVTDLVTDILVRYKGSLPDLFREGHSIVAEGFIRPWSSESTTVTPFSSGRSVTEKARANGCYFSAIEVLAKHDEKYMPKEVAAAIEKNRAAIEAANSSSQEQLQS